MDRAKLMAAMQATASEKPRPVDVPGWGTVYVKSLTVEEADIDEEQNETDKKTRTRLARAVAKLLCDETGTRILDPDNPEHLALVKKQPWKLLSKLLADPEEEKEKKGN